MRQGGWGRLPFALHFHLSFIICHLAKLRFALLFHLSFSEASLCAPFSFIIYHLSFSEAPLRANLNLSQNLKYLFSQSDGVALRHKHYSVESVGNDEDWQLCFAL